MEKRKKDSQTHNLSKIPELIDPGITLPIYEEDLVELNSEDSSTINQQHPQKLGSYRTKAGKFSNTLSNLLPSISAKLHHGKKTFAGTGKNLQVGSMSNSDVSNCVNGSESSSSLSQSGHVTPPLDVEQPGHLPESSKFIVTQQRQSNDSFTFGTNTNIQPSLSNTISRTRNNTMSSQITSMSGMVSGINPSNNMWGSSVVPTTPSDHVNLLTTVNLPQVAIPSHYDSSPLNECSTNNYFDIVSNQQQSILGISNNNNSGNGGNFWSQRTRSQSNASSIYMDAPLYDQVNPRTSAYTIMVDQGSSQQLSIPINQPQIVLNHSHLKQQSQSQLQQSHNPIVQDDVDPRSINWVTTDLTVLPINHISNLLPTNTISISNVYSLQQQQPHLSNAINLTSTSLATLCLKFGNVISARTLKGINMALVEFDTVDAAIRAKEVLQGKEVSLVNAPSVVSFAKMLPMHQQPLSPSSNNSNNTTSQSLLQEQLFSGAVQIQQQGNFSIPIFNAAPHSHQQPPPYMNHSYSTSHVQSEKEICPFPLPPLDTRSRILLVQATIDSFNFPHDTGPAKHIVSSAINFQGRNDTSDFGPLPEPLANREFDAPKLRELRKLIDAEMMCDLDIEQLAIVMLDELPELCSDYLGNTIVQKLFEHSSLLIKDIMLRQTNKYLTSMGVHKNGTWACQKIISMVHTPRQMNLVAKGVHEYCTPLFNDQFGNYVIQCVLKFGFPWNNFIFESIVANFWTIAQNRYGARAVRACLEAHDIITQEQLLVLSAMIVLYAEYLATNSNGALLVTWFLDTCTLPNRHSILTNKLVEHIVDLCCHRLASLTILKILNYRSDECAKRVILDAIFGPPDFADSPPDALHQLLNDSNYGPTFIYKVLSIPLLEGDIRNHVLQQVRRVLVDSNGPQHRRLMEEVGLVHNTNSTSTIGTNTKHHSGISHVFGADSSGHVRTVSVSSVRSNGSRNRALSTSALQQQQQQQQGLAQMNAPGAFYNYPGMFPINNSTYTMTNEELPSQFELMNLNATNQISLPQLSMSNQINSNNGNINNFNGNVFGF